MSSQKKPIITYFGPAGSHTHQAALENFGDNVIYQPLETIDAAELAASDPDSAAISGITCAELYGLNVLARGIQDLRGNKTRFFILGNSSNKSTGNDRTLILFTVDHRKSGALCDGIKIFKDNDINLTKIDSRPSLQRHWHYVFFVEFQGHKDDDKFFSSIFGNKEEQNSVENEITGDLQHTRVSPALAVETSVFAVPTNPTPKVEVSSNADDDDPPTFPLIDGIQRAKSSSSSNSLSTTSKKMKPLEKANKLRKKVALEPGHSPLDWARLEVDLGNSACLRAYHARNFKDIDRINRDSRYVELKLKKARTERDLATTSKRAHLQKGLYKVPCIIFPWASGAFR
ncbi:3743_t:CDS:2 [Acaulospora colombiana]|uniref:3743_t:CDS:1 n=1 Tax=Acaulospora colombiana TaxID=27376 RepID=A0ACA9KIZ2_9GLOM|nr:3743_t:CDS:2 [Acaulospora colombiana]